MATCLPPITALNAARIATSVLPKPTSPQISRSIGPLGFHVGLGGRDGRELVRGLLEKKRRLEFALPFVIRRKGEALCASRAAACTASSLAA